MKTPALVDQYGRPVERKTLTTEVAGATIGGVRSPISGYPGDGLNPVRLAQILREADAGDPVRYLELAEAIEERDPHYLGVLGTRRRSVAQIDITVEAASDAPDDVTRADMVRDWLKRDELAEEMFDILDAIGKGFSQTEIIWDTSTGQWMPERLEWRDPRWFRFARGDLKTPMILSDAGQEEPLPAFKFISAVIKAKSGLPLRSGLARVAAWGWLFKAYTARDWAIFTQTYGQPLRLGKYQAGASDADKATLFRAVANIAGDCAGIIPASMEIEFVETGSVGATSSLYKDRIEHLNHEISKAVLGQTATTDAVTGGLGSGKEHRQVQEDIERADARALSAILNRDLIRPWMQLNFGPLDAYPRLKIARPEPEDTEVLAKTAETAVRMGMKVSASKTRIRLGLDEPENDDDILQAKAAEKAPTDGPDADATDPAGRGSKIKQDPGEFKRGEALPGTKTALSAEGPLAGKKPGSAASLDSAALLAERMAIEAAPAMAAMMAQIEAMVAAASSMEELRAMLLHGFPAVDVGALADVIGLGLVAGHAAGQVAVEEEGTA